MRRRAALGALASLLHRPISAEAAAIEPFDFVALGDMPYSLPGDYVKFDRLIAAMQKAQQAPEWKQYLEQVTQLDGFMGPAEFHALLLKDIAELQATKKKLGL